jgi:predicted HAD superfamily phosphohydrolase YqeG
MAPLRDDWTSTAWQTLPRFWQLARKLVPTIHVADVTALDDEFLKRHEVAALIWDVDGTLMAYHHGRVADEFEVVLNNLRDKVPQAILSNCGEARFGQLGAIFAGLPVLKGYRLETSTLVFRCLRGAEDRWSAWNGNARHAIVRPAGRLTPLRKPSAELIDVALDELGVERGRRAFMVGDQYFTDIAGANLAGIGSIKVRTVRPDTFPLTVRCLQGVERCLYFLLHDRAARRREGAAPRALGQ